MCVLLQLEIPLETVLATIDTAYNAGVPVVLNPAPAKKYPMRHWQRFMY